MPKTAKASRPRGRPVGSGKNAAVVRKQILSHFAQRSSREGISAVSLSRLATELGMSIATIYKHFPSKEDLVAAAIKDWVQQYTASESVIENQKNASRADGLEIWANARAESLAQFSSVFWRELKRDYPQVWDEFNTAFVKTRQAGRELLEPYLRPNLNGDLAFELFDLIFTHVSKPEVAEKHGITRQEALTFAAKLWSNGALGRTRSGVKTTAKKTKK